MFQDIATFSIRYTQYLDSDGKSNDDLPACANDRELLVNLYQNMLLTRTLDKKAIAMQRTGKLGTYASPLGQEAISAAIGLSMQSDDVLCPYYRDYGAQIARGVKISEIYTYWGGNEFGSCYENNAHDLPISVPIASQCLHAAGAATAFKLRKQQHVALATVGDGGTSEGDFYETINVAGIWDLPLVIIVNNNQWAISVPRHKQTGTQTIAQKAIAAGIHCEQVDGNDVIACYERFSNVIEKARTKNQPAVVEAITYRLGDHTTADDASRYRDDAELQAAWEREPIKRLRQFLEQNHQWNEKDEQALIAECNERIEQATKTYLENNHVKPTDMFDYHYAELPVALAWQRALLMKEQQNG